MKNLLSIKILADNSSPTIAILYDDESSCDVTDKTLTYLGGYQLPFESLVLFVIWNKNKKLEFNYNSNDNTVEFFIENNNE